MKETVMITLSLLAYKGLITTEEANDLFDKADSALRGENVHHLTINVIIDLLKGVE